MAEEKETKRFCVTYMERARVEKPKQTGRQHSFFTAVDEADAENQFWRAPIWKPPVRKIEIVSVEPV